MMARKCLFIGLVSLLILSSMAGCRFFVPGQPPTQPGTTPLPPVVEVDVFPDTVAKVTVKTPTGQSFIVELKGPTTVHVFFEGATEGEARDDDGDGRDEVSTEIVAMNLTGISNMGQVEVRLNPDIRSTGEIEEVTNNTPGIMDLPPFATVGTANSFFNVYFEIEIGGVVLRTTEPKRMETVIRHKPPKEGDTYENPEWIPLVDLNGRNTGFFVGPAFHTPTPLTESTISIDCWPGCIPTATGASLEFQMLVRDLTNGQAPIVAVAIYIDGAVARTFGDMSEIQFSPTPGVTFRRETWPGPHDIRIVAVNAQGQEREQTWNVYCSGEPTDQPPDYQTPDDQPPEYQSPEIGPVCPDCGNPIEQCTCP